MHEQLRHRTPTSTSGLDGDTAVVPRHIVQFYEHDSFLCAGVADFFATGLRSGEPAVLVTTPEHARAIDAELVSQGIDPAAARAGGLLRVLDARTTLSRFMRDDMPDADRFRTVVNALADEARVAASHSAGRTGVRIFGEMVDLLWRENRIEAALRLEDLWHAQVHASADQLLCAYAMSGFYKEAHAETFEAICRAHTAVRPAETVTGPLGEKLQRIAADAQRAHALDHEIAHRRQLEASLRDALDRRRQSEDALREEAWITEKLNEVGSLVAAQLDRETVVQTVTDLATHLTGAQFGAFFYNVIDRQSGEALLLHTLSGAPKEAFAHFPNPRHTSIFGPTLRGEGPVRLDDVTADPRYGRNAPYFGTPPGHLPVCSYLAVPVIGGSGKVLGGLVFGHEARGVFQPRHERLVIGIADWAAVALENARLYQEAQQASRTKDEFLATVSHELRTPLNAILGWSHMLRGGLLKPPMTRRAIENIERNARAQAQLIDDLLDVSRIVSGNLEIRMEPVDLLRVISAAVDVVRPAALARDLDVQVHIDDAARAVTGDAARLQQVLWNLLSNAVKFTPAHGHVEVWLDRFDYEARITVRDTGQGLSAEFLPQAFDRFRQQQGDATRAHGGLGLGLSIVKYLTEAHGGAVAVHSDGEGRGATFQVTLPLRRERLGQGGQGTPPQTEVTEDVGRGPRALAGLRLLVVDDEPDGREVLRVMLDSQGADVLAVASAAEALDAIGTESFDMLLADIGMPGCDGYSLMEAVRARPKEEGGDLAAIAVTAYVGERERERAFAAGYQAHVTKPVDFDRLILRILDVMAARDAARRPSAT